MNPTYFKGKKILVTGGAGFIGSHLVRRLVSLGASVHLFLRTKTNRERLDDLSASIEIHDVDILEIEQVAELVQQIKPNGFFHLAAASQSFGYVPTNKEMTETNIISAIALMDALDTVDYDFFVNTGTFAEIGSKDHPIRENDSFEPKEFYGISRIPATLYGQTLGREKKKPVETVRVFTPYGPDMSKGKLVSSVVEKALRGEIIELTKPTVTRDLIYIDDLIDIYLLVAENARAYPGEVWNGGSGVATTLNELVETVRSLASSSSDIVWNGKDVSYDRARWQADVSKGKRLLGWTPDTNLETGLQQTIEWYRDRMR